MKRIVFAFVVALFVAASAFAGKVGIFACTADHKTAALSIITADGTSETIEKEIANAFIEAAKKLTAEQLVSSEGFDAFVANLSEEDIAAIESLSGPPTIGGACKVA